MVYLHGKKREIEEQMRCRGTRVCFSVSFQFSPLSCAQVTAQGCGVLGGQEAALMQGCGVLGGQEEALTGQQRGL